MLMMVISFATCVEVPPFTLSLLVLYRKPDWKAIEPVVENLLLHKFLKPFPILKSGHRGHPGAQILAMVHAGLHVEERGVEEVGPGGSLAHLLLLKGLQLRLAVQHPLHISPGKVVPLLVTQSAPCHALHPCHGQLGRKDIQVCHLVPDTVPITSIRFCPQ